MSQTDFLGINEHILFKQLAKSTNTNATKTLNIITVRDNVLYAWNQEDNCVLTLNIKAAREKEESAAKYQTLLPRSPPICTPEKLLVNETNTILIAAGPNGVIVFELPERTPPIGNFCNNKEVIYCRTYSLLENILAFSSTIECRQVRFHPGSATDSHLLLLTSDNIIRLFQIENNQASELGLYTLGVQPSAKIPDKKLTYLEVQGETAIDFDFSSPIIETVSYQKQTQARNIYAELVWPVFLLFGNGLVFKITIQCNGGKAHPGLFGPLKFVNFPDRGLQDYCSILCIPSTPPIVAIAHCNGNVFHGLELPMDDPKNESSLATRPVDQINKPLYARSAQTELLLFETVELELGLTTSVEDLTENSYTCPIFLQRDVAKPGTYFATHNTGVHSVRMSAMEELLSYLNSKDNDSGPGLFKNASSAEYIICTKTSITEKLNPVLGIGIVDEPHALITILANKNVVTLPIRDMRTIPAKQDNFDVANEGVNVSYTSLQNQNTPFDVYIQHILSQSLSQPILQSSSTSDHSQETCYEIFQRASKIFHDEHFKNLDKAREEIEKRVKQLKLMKEFQQRELKTLGAEKQILQSNAENLAEKYEDLKEKQEDITRRCQLLLTLLSRKQTEPTIAEEKYFEELTGYDKQIDKYIGAMEKLKDKVKYQRNQMVNWKREHEKPEELYAVQTEAIKKNLRDTSKKITDITAEMKIYMAKLNIK